MNLKIQPEHYDFLYTKLKESYKLNYEIITKNPDVANNHRRQAWDLWWLSDDGQKPVRYICDVLYKYLSDFHIDSAFRVILNQIKKEENDQRKQERD